MDRTLSMMEYEDWRQRCGICGAPDGSYHQHGIQELTPKQVAELNRTGYVNLRPMTEFDSLLGPESSALAQAQQQYPPGFVSSYEQANANHCGMSGASPLDSLLGPGLL